MLEFRRVTLKDILKINNVTVGIRTQDGEPTNMISLILPPADSVRYGELWNFDKSNYDKDTGETIISAEENDFISAAHVIAPPIDVPLGLIQKDVWETPCAAINYPENDSLDNYSISGKSVIEMPIRHIPGEGRYNKISLNDYMSPQVLISVEDIIKYEAPIGTVISEVVWALQEMVSDRIDAAFIDKLERHLHLNTDEKTVYHDEEVDDIAVRVRELKAQMHNPHVLAETDSDALRGENLDFWGMETIKSFASGCVYVVDIPEGGLINISSSEAYPAKAVVKFSKKHQALSIHYHETHGDFMAGIKKIYKLRKRPC